MRFALIGNRETWTKYAGELLIVAAGVALGLWANEWVSSRKTAEDVRDATSALRAELADNLIALRSRQQVQSCVDRRLAELRQWAVDHRNGNHRPLPEDIGRPGSRTLSTSVWEITKAGEVAARMPLKERLAYATGYDYLDGFYRLQVSERDIWFEIGDFGGAEKLTASELRRFQGLLGRAAAFNEALSGNIPEITHHIAGMGVKQTAPVPAGLSARRAICRSFS